MMPKHVRQVELAGQGLDIKAIASKTQSTPKAVYQVLNKARKEGRLPPLPTRRGAVKPAVKNGNLATLRMSQDSATIEIANGHISGNLTISGLAENDRSLAYQTLDKVMALLG